MTCYLDKTAFHTYCIRIYLHELRARHIILYYIMCRRQSNNFVYALRLSRAWRTLYKVYTDIPYIPTTRRGRGGVVRGNLRRVADDDRDVYITAEWTTTPKSPILPLPDRRARKTYITTTTTTTRRCGFRNNI